MLSPKLISSPWTEWEPVAMNDELCSFFTCSLVSKSEIGSYEESSAGELGEVGEGVELGERAAKNLLIMYFEW